MRAYREIYSVLGYYRKHETVSYLQLAKKRNMDYPFLEEQLEFEKWRL